jgi:hypothetical protein
MDFTDDDLFTAYQQESDKAECFLGGTELTIPLRGKLKSFQINCCEADAEDYSVIDDVIHLNLCVAGERITIIYE